MGCNARKTNKPSNIDVMMYHFIRKFVHTGLTGHFAEYVSIDELLDK
jgi:hypothetical protein